MVKEGDVFSRGYTYEASGYHYSRDSTTKFLVVTSIRKGAVHAKECWKKREAQLPRGYRERLIVESEDEFTQHIMARRA